MLRVVSRRLSSASSASSASRSYSSPFNGMLERGRAMHRKGDADLGDVEQHGKDKSTLMFSVVDAPGALSRVLEKFGRLNINMTRLESRPSSHGSDFKFIVCFKESDATKQLMDELNSSADCSDAHLADPQLVPWFPTRIQDLDLFANEVLDAGADLESDHPGFNDKEYRDRRQELAKLAVNHRHGRPFPRVKYTQPELDTWRAVYEKVVPLHKQYACKEHLDVFPELEKHCGYAVDNIPQAEDISQFLVNRTGFRLRPVAGLLSARNFLYGLAFRVFFSTQYIRHHSLPLYTPEPDICHELLGHAPLFADPAFADFSQEVGLSAIGATDDQITQLARCYWFSVEYGLCKENGRPKAYGAGLLSSFGELEYSMGPEPEILPWDPFDAATRDYPITKYQPTYYLAESFTDARDRLKEFTAGFARPYNASYNKAKNCLEVDRNVRMSPFSK